MLWPWSYACPESLQTTGPGLVCSHQIAQVKLGTALFSTNSFIFCSFITASHEAQRHHNVIKPVRWALLSVDEGSLRSRRWTGPLEGFCKNKYVRFCSLPKTTLILTSEPEGFLSPAAKNKQNLCWPVLWNYLIGKYPFKYFETINWHSYSISTIYRT